MGRCTKGCHKPYLDEAGEQQHGVQDQAQELPSPPGAQAQVGVQQHRQPEDEEGLLQRLQAVEAVSQHRQLRHRPAQVAWMAFSSICGFFKLHQSPSTPHGTHARAFCWHSQPEDE